MSWLQKGGAYLLRDAGMDIDNLPSHIFTVEFNPDLGEVYLNHQQDQFTFPYKMYGSSDTFPERVATTYRMTAGNLGVLLTGIKGTGKTVQAEQICNILKLPVLLVTSDFDGRLVPFLNRIQDDVVVFIDEYEKIYERSNALLSVMDGALRTKFRRVYLLTTNETYISDSMVNRPSRILYMKRFGNLNGETIKEIVDDMLADTMQRDAAIRFLGGLDIITVDIVKAVCAEMVRFGELPTAFKQILNISSRPSNRKNISHVLGGKKHRLGSYAYIDPANPFRDGALGDTLGMRKDDDNWVWFGDIESYNEENGTVVTNEGTFVVEDPVMHPSLEAVL